MQKIKQKLLERWRFLTLPYGQISYAQNAEDLVLAKFLDARLKQKNYRGFYVDVGAHHPFRYSNTYYFYQRGWSGINIDADPWAIERLKRWRARDINLQALIGRVGKNKTLLYYIFDNHAFNTADEKLAQELIKSGRAQLLEKTNLPMQNLNQLLQQYLPAGQKIDFMSIDIEGLDLEALQSLDFKLFSLDYILLEDLSFQQDQLAKKSQKITLLLEKQGYSLVSRVFNTAIWQHRL